MIFRSWRTWAAPRGLQLAGGALGDGKGLRRTMDGIEERLVRQALARTGGVKAEAARLLGIKKSTLEYKTKKYGI